MTTPRSRFRTAAAALAALLATSQASAQTALINALDDLSGSWNGIAAQIQLTSSHCVAVSNGGEYRVTITGSGSGGAFQLASGTKQLAYTVQYRDANIGFATVTAGTSLTGLDTSDTSTASCSGTGAVAQVRVTFANTALAAAAAGTYTGTLTILVTPT